MGVLAGCQAGSGSYTCSEAKPIFKPGQKSNWRPVFPYSAKL